MGDKASCCYMKNVMLSWFSYRLIKLPILLKNPLKSSVCGLLAVGLISVTWHYQGKWEGLKGLLFPLSLSREGKEMELQGLTAYEPREESRALRSGTGRTEHAGAAGAGSPGAATGAGCREHRKAPTMAAF